MRKFITIISFALIARLGHAASSQMGAGLATIGQGVDLVAQSATITAQTLYTPTSNSTFRISAWAARTRAATTSSTIGSLTITWTDADTNTSMTYTVPMLTSAGMLATTNANNLITVTGTCQWIPLMIYAKSGVAITFTLTYISAGVTTMQYALHMKCEAM